MKSHTRVLTIAGSDSGGGAGIQADLKAISACGGFGMSAITAITAQNTLGVTDIHPVPLESIEAQIRAVFDDIGADSVKIGMLHSVGVIETLSKLLREYTAENVVLDPVMVATSGDRLIMEDAVQAMTDLLFPLATLITPNIPEIEILLNHDCPASPQQLASTLGQKMNVSVLAKGGHLEKKEVTDALYEKQAAQVEVFTNRRIETENTHGTGCTLSSAIATYLGQSFSLSKSCEYAISYINGAIQAGSNYSLGQGHGPVHHFFRFW